MASDFRSRLAKRVLEVNQTSQAKRRGEMPLAGVATGVELFDDRFGGWVRGLNVIGMDSGAGKSSSVVNFVLEGAKLEKPVRSRVDSSEDSEDVWQDRILAHETGIDSEDIEAGRLTEEQELQLVRACASMPEVLLNCDVGRTPTQIVKQANETLDEWDVLYVDYLQTLAPESDFEAQNDPARITNAIRLFAWAASKWGKPVVVISQFTKALEYRGKQANNKNRSDFSGYIPVLGDLYGSAVIKQKARLCLLASRPKQYDRSLERDTQVWYLAKRNRGRGGMEFEFDCDMKTARISNGRIRL